MAANRLILLQPGEVLYREGDPNDCGFVIESGEVLLHAEVDGVRVEYERRSAGSIVGELSILTGKPRVVTVEATQPSRIFRISARQILDRFERLDPVLRACVDTSINFAARYSEEPRGPRSDVPLAAPTLRNSEEFVERLRLEEDIKLGLADGEFFMLFQPIVRIMDGAIVGVEALMRWQHATLGSISPGKFIEIAEAIETISDLTRFAISEAVSAWQHVKVAVPEAETFFVSVNVSGAEIARPDFADYVSFVMDQHAMLPGALRLEVTETTVLSDPLHAVENLCRLRDLGCGISLDDFGTGYSNLAQLKKLPLSTLKIDKVFAGDVHRNLFSRNIVRMLVDLGREMKMTVIAEGVEDKENVDALLDLGCHFAQGYYFHKPLSETDLISLMQDRSDVRLKSASWSKI